MCPTLSVKGLVGYWCKWCRCIGVYYDGATTVPDNPGGRGSDSDGDDAGCGSGGRVVSKTSCSSILSRLEVAFDWRSKGVDRRLYNPSPSTHSLLPPLTNSQLPVSADRREGLHLCSCLEPPRSRCAISRWFCCFVHLIPPLPWYSWLSGRDIVKVIESSF